MMPYDERVLPVVGGILAIFGGFIAIISIVMYVFQSIGLFKIGKNMGTKLYGFAWVPFLSGWVVGAVADKFDLVVNNKVKKQRHLLLWMGLAVFIISAVVSVISFAAYFNIVDFSGGLTHYTIDSSALQQAILPTLGTVVISSLVLSVLSIVYMVFYYISLYKLYKACNPSTCVVFTVLSIIFNITQPFFLFADRNKMLGMPDTIGVTPESVE